MPTISKILSTLDARFPLARAESWDKTGLQIGDAGAEADSVLVAYEITDAVLSAAREGECLVVYHPLLFRPLENLDFKNHTARLAARIIERKQSLIALHTALDGAAPPHALGDQLAAQLEIQNSRVLKASGRQKLVKIGVHVPSANLSAVCEAAWKAGAGKIGRNYDQASFRFGGEGTFRPLAGAKPHLGEKGKLETVDEVRLEIVCDESKFSAAIASMKGVHAYEEMAYDVVSLLNTDENQNYGPARIGSVMEQTLNEFAAFAAQKLGAPNVRIVRAKETIHQVVCSPGAGASFIAAAARAGADCLVCGDIKHHDALQARALGLSVVDVTHAATETTTIGMMADVLDEMSGLEVRRAAMENPFS